MAQANRAYEQADEAMLRAILQEYEASPEGVLGDGTAAELVRIIRKIAQVKRRLSDIDRETNDIVASELNSSRRRHQFAILSPTCQSCERQIRFSRPEANSQCDGVWAAC